MRISWHGHFSCCYCSRALLHTRASLLIYALSSARIYIQLSIRTSHVLAPEQLQTLDTEDLRRAEMLYTTWSMQGKTLHWCPRCPPLLHALLFLIALVSMSAEAVGYDKHRAGPTGYVSQPKFNNPKPCALLQIQLTLLKHAFEQGGCQDDGPFWVPLCSRPMISGLELPASGTAHSPSTTPRTELLQGCGRSKGVGRRENH